MTPQQIITDLLNWNTTLSAGKPTPLGDAILALSDPDLVAVAAEVGRKAINRLGQGDRALLTLIADHAPARLAPLFAAPELEFALPFPPVAATLLQRHPAEFEPLLHAKAEDPTLPDDARLGLKIRLAIHDPTRYADTAYAATRKLLPPLSHPLRQQILDWLSREAPPEGIAVFAELMARPDSVTWYALAAIDQAVRRLGQAALPAVRAAVAHSEGGFRNRFVEHLITLADPADLPLIEASLSEALAAAKPKDLPDIIRLVGRSVPARFADRLWGYLEHTSKLVRRQAALALARLGPSVLERGRTLLAAKKTVIREAIVDLFGAVGTPEALADLEARVDVEDNDDVRDALLHQLAPSWRAAGRQFSKADLREHAARDPKLKPVMRDLNYAGLPPLHFPDGERWTTEEVRWLLGRAVRTHEDEPDIEFAMALPLIDRARSADFALALLELPVPAIFFTAAALLGDDRAVHAMHSLIRKYADGTGHKTAESLVGRLALNGSDVALMTVDSLSRRYASKKRQVGEAAEAAFAAAAARAGVSVDELGDRVVPWLGFEPGVPRKLEFDGKQFEVRVGLDWKLQFVDLAKRKPVAALPKSAPAAVLAEFKETAATLREVSKAQVARLENLLVRQQRWPLTRWRGLYLRHPLLVPFAVRLVWGEYGPDGRLRQTFRALEDGTLTGPEDAVTLADDSTVGLVHPLDLDPALLAQWQEHLMDYKVIPPFAQLERPVIRVPEGREGDTANAEHAGKQLNALTVRGRLERWGWLHAARGDHGHLMAFAKRFGTAGVDAVVRLEDGIMAGVGPEDQTTLAPFFFVRSGTLNFASWSGESPLPSTDDRLVSLGRVPAVAYSETAGEMARLVQK